MERDREREREADALAELLSLASLFPLLRPLDPRFDAWAASVGDGTPTRELVDWGLKRVGQRERKRIVSGAEALVGALGEAERQAMLVGSVVAALQEQRALEPAALDHLESCEGCRGGAAESLAAVLDACDLRSFGEAAQAEEALDRVPEADGDDGVFAATLTFQAGSIWSDQHARRLELLVSRVRAQLPLAGRSLASAALGEACAAVERESAVRTRLAGLLLADTLGPARLIRLAA